MATFDINAAVAIALPFIKERESCRLVAYPDPATHAEPWTIGYGATGSGITRDTVWTQDQADQDLEQRVQVLAEHIGEFVCVSLAPESAAALISFAYNTGQHALAESTLLRYLNNGAYRSAAAQFDKWIYAAGHPNPGLQKRRALEKQLFLQGVDSVPGPAADAA